MNKITKRLVSKISVISLLLAALLTSPVFADDCVETNLFGRVCDDGSGSGIFLILNVVLTVLTFGVGILGVVGIVIAGIQYSTARDNEQQMAKAKMRIVQIVIGMAIWAFLYAILAWLLPGANFGQTS